MSRNFKNWLSAYADHTAVSEAPRSFHFWTAVSVLGGALQRHVWIDQRIFEWTPNFYIILVGPPGVATKSTSMKVGYSLLRQVPGVRFGPQSMTWQGLGEMFREAMTLYNEHPMSCLTCDVSELGTFLRPDDKEMVNFLVDMWDAPRGPWKRALKTSENTVIENPWLNIMGCTTPSWLRENFTSSMIYGGLTSRCVFVWGAEKEQLIAYPSAQIESQPYRDNELRLIEDLVHISELFGEYELTSEAQAWGQSWYETHWNTRPDYMISSAFDGYLARKQTHIHKLALAITAANHDAPTISRKVLELADGIVTGLESDMLRVFDSIGGSESSQHTQVVLDIISRAGGTIARQELWRHCMKRMDETQFNSAINANIAAGYLRTRRDTNYIYYSIIVQSD